MFKDRMGTLRYGSKIMLGCLLLASSIQAARSDACPSIDFWLERIRERGGQHRLLDTLELSRSIGIFEASAKIHREHWTSGAIAIFADGSGWVLLNVETSVCGVIEVPPGRWPAVRRTIGSQPTSSGTGNHVRFGEGVQGRTASIRLAMP